MEGSVWKPTAVMRQGAGRLPYFTRPSRRCPVHLCWGTNAERGQELYQILCGGVLEGAIIVLACIIFSLFAASPPAIDPNAAAVTQVWSYIGELVFNMLVLVGAVKMADRVVREMMGL